VPNPQRTLGVVARYKPVDSSIITPSAEAVRAAFPSALADFRRSSPALVMSHNDADGLSAAAILARALGAAGWPVRIRVLWSDLEAAFDLEGLAANPPLALIRNVLVRCGAPAWVWDAEAQIDQVGVMFTRAWSRSAA
jgi:hypothetical protein